MDSCNRPPEDFGPWLQQFDGMPYDYLNPSPEQVSIQRIAHSLARLERYNGHTSRRSIRVGAHSVAVARTIWAMTNNPYAAMAGLLHDGAESVTGDLTRPFQEALFHLCPEAKAAKKAIEDTFNKAMLAAAGLPENLLEEYHDIVKRVDNAAVITEKQLGMAEPRRPWRLQGESLDFLVGSVAAGLALSHYGSREDDIYSEFMTLYYRYVELIQVCAAARDKKGSK